MDHSAQARTFRFGDDVAIHLPEEFGIEADTLMSVEVRGGELVFRVINDELAETQIKAKE